MSYEPPPRRIDAVQEIVDVLRAAQRVVLTTHLNADGDGVGSQIALGSWLRALGKEVAIVNPTPFPAAFEFLLPDPGWVLPAAESAALEACREADIAVVLDTGEVPRLGRVKPMIDAIETIVVDHHPLGDQPIPGISLRDATACATGELVFDILKVAKGPWPQSALEGVYVAILTDTGSFRFNNSTPASHRISAEIIESGVDPEELYRRVYGSAPLRRFWLLRACLDTIEVDPEDGTVAWMMVPRDVAERLGSTPDDVEGLVDYPRAIEGVEVALLFRQTHGGDTKVSFRSNGQVDVNRLARDFGGGGHVRASGALIPDPPHKVVPKVVAQTRDAVRLTRRSLTGVEGPPGQPTEVRET